MRISNIFVQGLFGVFDHVIPLNIAEHITIIHGPNGFGKTVLLTMIANLFRHNYEILHEIPFKKLEINFDDGSYIILDKVSRSRQYVQQSLFEMPREKDRTLPAKVEIRVKVYRYNQGSTNFLLPLNKENQRLFRYARAYGEQLGLERITASLWRNPSTGERFSSREILEKYGNFPFEVEDLSLEPEIFKEMIKLIDVHFIETQRLLNTSEEGTEKKMSVKYAVEQYGRELAETIRKKLAESVALSQSLDRTFPVRLVELVAQNEQPEISSDKLREQLDNLEEKRSRLIEAGLLDKEEDMAFQIYRQTDERLRSVISVYIQDVEKKLNIFNDLAERIDLLKKIVNARFSYKKMVTSKEQGFRFRTHDGATSLISANLSSGEQHELILLYELLFKVKSNSLILIDEPEISLHVAWQKKFLEDLQEIAAISSFDVLIATHSPQLINNRWDLTVELKGQDK